MSRYITKTRGVGRSILLLTSATLLLASCASASTARHADGQPSISINAPLTAVACTTTGACVAVGASGGAGAPTTTAQVRNHQGIWSALQVPGAPVATIYAGACATTRCLFGGTDESGELLWSINANTGAVKTLRGPAGGLVIHDLSCVDDHDCAVLDATANSTARFSFTTSAGGSWSAPRTLAWTASKSTTMTCVGARTCYVATTSATHHVVLRETLNGGRSWRAVTTPTAWTSLSSLDCSTTCVALVTTTKGSAVAVPSTKVASQGWSETYVPLHASSMSCSSVTTCLVVGHLGGQTPAMSEWQSSGAHNVTLDYVPSALTDVACRPSICVAIALTTVVALRP